CRIIHTTSKSDPMRRTSTDAWYTFFLHKYRIIRSNPSESSEKKTAFREYARPPFINSKTNTPRLRASPGRNKIHPIDPLQASRFPLRSDDQTGPSRCPRYKKCPELLRFSMISSTKNHRDLSPRDWNCARSGFYTDQIDYQPSHRWEIPRWHCRAPARFLNHPSLP